MLRGVIMKSWKPFVVITGIAPLLLSGCAHLSGNVHPLDYANTVDCAQLRTAHILLEDNSQVAIALDKINKSQYTNTVIDVKKGQRVEPCKSVYKVEQKQSQHGPSNNKLCRKINEDDIIFSEHIRVDVWKGSTCFSIWIGDTRYDFCDQSY
jgi:hypothetical protein